MPEDIFVKHQASIDAVKAAGQFDVYGTLKRKLPCDNISEWASCKGCPEPCKEPETVLSGKKEE
jgi:hypothetical protein